MEKGVTSSDSGLGFNNPFGEQERRSSADENAFSKQRSNDESLRDVSGSPPEGLSPEPKSRDRSMSKEWGMYAYADRSLGTLLPSFWERGLSSRRVPY